MIREQAIEILESKPNEVMLSDGSYILWDKKDGYYRVSYFSRKNVKGSDLEMTIALAIKKPIHSKKVKDIFQYIENTKEFSDASSS
jgi:hypothetical protein